MQEKTQPATLVAGDRLRVRSRSSADSIHPSYAFELIELRSTAPHADDRISRPVSLKTFIHTNFDTVQYGDLSMRTSSVPGSVHERGRGPRRNWTDD
jgi:hypothetical protein